MYGPKVITEAYMMQVEFDGGEDANIRDQLLPVIIGLLRSVSIICNFHIWNVVVMWPDFCYQRHHASPLLAQFSVNFPFILSLKRLT